MSDFDRRAGMLFPQTERLAGLLLSWYSENARDLPWRKNRDSYRIWVSEIMLQQTRVEAVKPYYERFLSALPALQDLASCPEDRLLKLWEGLGYYSRVRNMQKTADILTKRGMQTLPEEYEELLKLPGIGAYTAGAIASIAYSRPVAAVDGNVIRVFIRLLSWDTDSKDPKTAKQIRDLANRMIRLTDPGRFNQALMELGATVCLPNGVPDCGKCPLSDLCMAKQEGRQNDLPRKAAKISRKIEEKTILLIQDSHSFWIRKRPAGGLLAGMYELPSMTGMAAESDVLDQVKAWGLSPVRIRKLKDAKHIFSHIEWRMTGFSILVEELPEGKSPEGYFGADAGQTMERYPVPAAFDAYVKEFRVLLGAKRFEYERNADEGENP